MNWNSATDTELVAAILGGDEEAFAWFVRKNQGGMHRVARGLVRSAAVADEVVQDTWAAVLGGLSGFRGEASLRNWTYRILVNRARRTARREGRSLNFADLGRDEEVEADVLDRYTAEGKWARPVQGWRSFDPETRAMSQQALGVLAAALDELPENQRVVVSLRDVEGVASAEVCRMLDISEANQRVLLHRGRSRLRKALEQAEVVPGNSEQESR